MSSAEPGASRRLLALLIGLAAAVAVIDQVTKQVALTTLGDGRYIPLVGEYFGFRLVFNPGAAFSMASGTTWLFTIISAVVVVVILRYARRLRSVWWAVALGLLLGGAVGNLIDRIFRDPAPFQGHVIDFISYYNWFVGNIADIGIVVAAILICLLALTGREIDGTRLGQGDSATPDETEGADGIEGSDDAGNGEEIVAAPGAVHDVGHQPAADVTATVEPDLGTAVPTDAGLPEGSDAATRGDSVAGEPGPGTEPIVARGERVTRRELRRRRQAAETAARSEHGDGTDG